MTTQKQIVTKETAREIRFTALSRAVELSQALHLTTPGEVLAAARQFAAFIKDGG